MSKVLDTIISNIEVQPLGEDAATNGRPVSLRTAQPGCKVTFQPIIGQYEKVFVRSLLSNQTPGPDGAMARNQARELYRQLVTLGMSPF